MSLIPASEEAAAKLALMPINLFDWETDDNKIDLAPKNEAIKYTTEEDDRKVSYSSYYISGIGGLPEIVTHAMFTEQSIDELQTLSHLQKALAFKKSLAGKALANAGLALAETREGLINEDNNALAAEGNPIRYTFHDFIINYCHQEGHSEDRYNQLEGLKHLRKPRDISVHRWDDIIKTKYKVIFYLQGQQDQVLTDSALKRVFFDSCPKKWKTSFEDQPNTNVDASTMDEIIRHMNKQEAKARAKAACSQAAQATNKKRNRPDSPERKSNKGYKKPGGWNNNKKKKPNNKPSNNETKLEEGQCGRCRHKHLWKDCFFNPHNPKNKLTQIANAAKGNNNKNNNRGEHNHHVDSSEDTSNNVGFVINDENQNDTINGKQQTSRKSMPLSTITNTISHHIDCFAISSLDEQQISGPMIPTSDITKGQSKSLFGNPCNKVYPTKLKTSGMNMKPDVLPRNKAEQVEAAISESLMSQDFSICETKQVSFSDSDLKNINPPLSMKDIVPGADTPMLIIVIDTIQGIKFQKPLRALVDSGSKRSFVYNNILPQGVIPTILDKPITTNLLDTATSINRKVRLQNIVLPELSNTTKIVQPFDLYVAEANATNFDLILGQDFNIAVGLDVINTKCCIVWQQEFVTPFRQIPVRTNRFIEMQRQYMSAFSPEEEKFDTMHSLTAEILAAQYERFDVDAVADSQQHLSPTQRHQLKMLLRQFPQLFSNELRVYPHKKIHLELKDDAKPSYKRAYPVAQIHLKVFKNELERLCQIGVLRKTGASQWASPTFVIPKKDHTVRWVSDLRELNKMIKRRVYPIPRIADVIRRRKGYKYLTKLDISMQFYTFELDEESKKICTISTPFGNYEYQRLPMGCNQSPDISQEIMETVLSDLEDIEVYFDDVGVFNDTWEKHLKILEIVLTRLESNGFIINPRKCEWAVKETEFLGHYMTPTGIKPLKRKVEAILKLERPTTITQVRSFIGAVNFYRDMYPKRSHILTPLHELTGLKNGKQFKWLPEHQKAFDAMKAIMAHDAFVRYPDPNKPYHIFTDASDLQLGAVIMQDDMPIAFYSRKLNPAQRNYTTMEKELLSIVETFREYRTILYGCKELHVHTDHKNLTYANLNSQRVMRWRLYLEEFAPQFHYIKGTNNVFADALSRLPHHEGRAQGTIDTAEQLLQQQQDYQYDEIEPTEASLNEFVFSTLQDDIDIIECLFNFPDVTSEKPFALDFAHIAKEQEVDHLLQQSVANNPELYQKKELNNGKILILHVSGNKPKICIPNSLLDTIISFYHQVLGHLGSSRMETTIGQHFTHPKLHDKVLEYTKTCDTCQVCKINRVQYGELPERISSFTPWSEIAVDTIGPWTIRDQQGSTHSFKALTIIDTVTNLLEIVRTDNGTAEHTADLFRHQWLSRYPKPNSVIFDPGTEFKGAFKEQLYRYGITPHPSSVKNPQSNAIVERVHQTIGDMLRALVYENPPEDLLQATKIVDDALSKVAYAARSSIHSTLGISPGALVYNRDMILDIPIIADLEILRDKRQQMIHKNLLKANKHRVLHHDYKVGDLVYKLIYKPDKLEPRVTGPYPVKQVHINGTLTVQKTALITERLNIRRVKPHFSRSPIALEQQANVIII
jgi:hypothetical protein